MTQVRCIYHILRENVFMEWNVQYPNLQHVFSPCFHNSSSFCVLWDM